MDAIAAWLDSLGLGKYTELFVENDIDFEILPDLSENHLAELGISLGHRIKLLKAISALQSTASQSDSAFDTQAPDIKDVDTPSALALDTLATTNHAAERRHLTTLFIDLVGSTPLSYELDPEDLREVILAYQEVASEELRQFDGYISRYMGDGILVYFGWPRAHEDDAERAVRAALNAVAAVEKLHKPDGSPLSARAGIATGLVVVGDLIGKGASEQQAVVGETPNLAARLQGVAQPGEVVIGESTRRLIGELFELKSLGVQELKGIGDPTEAFIATGERVVRSRFHARSAEAELPLVGRQNELGLLLDCWNQASTGSGQAVLVCGEAGIGKSRLINALENTIQVPTAHRIHFQCSPYHTDTALHPILRQLTSAADIATGNSNSTKRAKLESLLHSYNAPQDTVRLITTALGIDNDEPLSDNYSPTQQRLDTLRCLVKLYTDLSAVSATLIIIEDLHWIDPTTAELLLSIVASMQSFPLMLLVTTRPHTEQEFAKYPNVTQLQLSRLGHESSTAIIEGLTKGKSLPGTLLDDILKKTDGVPLFVEELTKTVLQSGQLTDTGDSYQLSGFLDTIEIPSSLHDSLMARLDRLEPVREIAQIAACIGREFSHDLIMAVAQVTAAELTTVLGSLIKAELIFRRGIPPHVSYTFKHALVRDAAYESLLRTRRQFLHIRIAEVLENDARFTETTPPELLAQHYSIGEKHDKAIKYWIAATQQAQSLSSNNEALAHAEAGYLQLKYQPDNERQRYELDLCFASSMAYRCLHGFHSEQFCKAIKRARELAGELGETEIEISCVRGLYNYYFNRGEHNDADVVIKESLTPLLAKQSSSFPGASAGANFLYRGELVAARSNLEELIAGLDEAESYPERIYVLNPLTSALANLSWTLWLLGYPEKAIKAGSRAIDIARRINQPFSFAMAVVWVGSVHVALGKVENRSEVIAEALEVIHQNDFQAWRPRVVFLDGKNDVFNGNTESGLQKMRDAMKVIGDRGSMLAWTWLNAELASDLINLKQFDECEELLNQGINHGESQGENNWLPELYRLKGELLLATGKGGAQQSRSWFEKALATAAGQQSRSCELRAATSLATLATSSYDDNSRLQGAYNAFTEGHETQDLIAANLLL